jgi:hypothetical protein
VSAKNGRSRSDNPASQIAKTNPCSHTASYTHADRVMAGMIVPHDCMAEIALVAPEPALVVRSRLYEPRPETLTATLLDMLKAVDVVYRRPLTCGP